jgi:integrase
MAETTRALTTDEVNVVSKTFSGKFELRDRAFFVMGTKTGLRCSELLSLRVEDVYQFGRVSSQVSVRRANTKGKRAGRTVPLHPEARAALQAWIEHTDLASAPGDRPLFPSQKAPSEPISRVQAWRILNGAYVANELDGHIGCHGMRKHLAERIYQQTSKDIVAVKDALGHRSLSSTTAYLRTNKATLEAAFLA